MSRNQAQSVSDQDLSVRNLWRSSARFEQFGRRPDNFGIGAAAEFGHQCMSLGPICRPGQCRDAFPKCVLDNHKRPADGHRPLQGSIM